MPYGGVKSNIVKLSESRAMWLAGIIDSDGYISFKNRYNCIDYVRVAVTSNSLLFLTKISEFINGGIIHKKQDAPSGPVYDLYLRNQESLDILPQIIPFLIIKQDKAIEALNELLSRKHLNMEEK